MKITKNEYVFKADIDEKKIYILNSGIVKLFLESSDGEKEYGIYKIKETGAIIGITETFLNSKRLVSMKAISDEVDCRVIDLTGKKIKDIVLANPKIGLQFAINLAVRFKRTNNQITVLSKILEDIKSNTNELCLDYYNCTEDFAELHKKFQFPWLKEIYETAKQNLIYRYGYAAKTGKDVLEEMVEAKKNVVSAAEKEELTTSSAKTFKQGDVLCNEGETGNEIYILMEGELSVYINNDKVAEITKKGAIIGEIAVLIGLRNKTFEKRTATVKVKKEAKIICIPHNQISAFFKKDPNLIMHINTTLAERLPESYNKLVEIYEKMDKAINLLNPYAATSSTCPKAFQNILELVNSKCNDPEKVSGTVQKMNECITKSKTDYNKYNVVYEKLFKD
jgi:CRP-like cAMP-binding protein